MNEQKVLQILKNVGAVITDSHIVYTSGKHGDAYINKDAIYPHIDITLSLCSEIVTHFCDDNYYGIEVVAAPAIGGIILANWIAYELWKRTERQCLMVYADKVETDEKFIFKRGYEKFLPGKRVLVVEDVLTTGGSAKKVVENVRLHKGNVLAVAAFCNRGRITSAILDVPELFSLINVNLDAWDEENCPLCAQGVPVNEDVGKGREYLARKGGTS